MKFTNNFNIKSRAIIGSLTYDTYDYVNLPNVFSATTIIDTPTIWALKRAHGGELTSDISDNFYIMLGKSIHGVVENNVDGLIKEKRVYLEITPEDEHIKTHEIEPGKHVNEHDWYNAESTYIACKPDIYDEQAKRIEDVKVSGAYSFVYPKPGWDRQLNIYAFAFRRLGYHVDRLQVNGLIRDWSRYKALADKNYPQSQIVEKPIKVWSDAECIKYIRERLELFRAVEVENLEQCSKDDRWHRDGKLAVMKNKNKTATKLFDTSEREAAEKYMGDCRTNGKPSDTFSIVERPGVDVRCDDYCLVNKWCPYYWTEQNNNS